MFYIIYKTTNKINGKFYIGKHQTKDLNDGYLGSGKHLKRSIQKYGVENFSKDILYQFDNEADMSAKEAELVTEEFVKEDSNYNLCPGGQGGFGYINANVIDVELILRRSKLGRLAADKKLIEKYGSLENFYQHFSTKGKTTKSQRYANDSNYLEMKQKMAIHAGKFAITEKSNKKRSNSMIGKYTGTQNSQSGTMWITDGVNNKKIKKDIDIMPEHWYKGRTL